MRRAWGVILALALATSLVGWSARAVAAPGQALVIWTQSTAYKVQPSTAPGTATSILLEGGRDSYETYQVIVRASGAALSGVNASAGDLTDGAGHTIPAANLTLFREAFIDFAGVSAGVDTGNWPVPAFSPTHDSRLPDPLVPLVDPYTGQPAGGPFAVPGDSNQPLWLDVYIPKATAAGLYHGSVRVTAAGQAAVVVPLTLNVWDLTLPDMRTVTTWYGLGGDDIIHFHSGTYQCSQSSCWLDWNARSRTILKRYEELAHSHRVDTGQAFVADPTNGCDAPSSWTDYDAAVQPYMDGSYWSDGVPSTYLETPFTPGAPWGIQTSCNQAQYTALAAAWASHLRSRGWFDRALVYALDEPDPPSYAAIATNSAWMQAADPGWKAQIMDTTSPRPGNVATLNPALGIYSVALSWYDHWESRDTYGRAEWPALFAQGIRLWFYESNAQANPYPTYATNTLLGLEPRIMHWGAWYESASGFLMWSVNTWDRAHPWGPNTLYGKTGDGVLLYPGNHDGLDAPAGSPPAVSIDGPVPSYRLKMIRAGMQDWALFRLAEQRGLGAYARAQVAQVYGQLGGCTWQGCPPPVNGHFFWKTDDDLMLAIRHNIALAILKPAPTYLPVILR